MRTQVGYKGFTLLELMVVVLTIVILASIAVPQYNQYIRKSQRSATQSEMLRVAGDLERWRSKTLTYRGFTPDISYASDTSITAETSSTLYFPKGSSSTNYKYKVAVLDGADRSKSLTTGTGQTWIMVAQPNTSNSILNSASRLVLNSRGVRCLTDSILTDATLKTNITTSSIDDSALCSGTSLPW